MRGGSIPATLLCRVRGMTRAPKNADEACSNFVANDHMATIEPSQLFYRLVSAIACGDRTARGQISQGQIYQLFDLICDAICTESVMVVSANRARFTHAVTGKFGKDDPWPEWCNPHGLQREIGMELTENSRLPLAKYRSLAE